MNEIDFRCPKCKSENTTRVPIELFDGVKGLWYSLIILSLLGCAFSPAFIFLCMACIIIAVIINIVRKISHRNEWVMQCSRCGCEFAIINPDKAEILEAKNQKKVQKQQEEAGRRTEKYKAIAEQKAVCLARNGQLAEDEILVEKVDYFGFHKNAFSNSQGKLIITNKSLICYNEKGCFRILRDRIQSVKKKNYFLCIPTGIQIRVNDKRKKYNFVVIPSERNEILENIKK